MLAAAMPIVHFQYMTGLARSPFTAAESAWELGWLGAASRCKKPPTDSSAEVMLEPGQYRWGVELERSDGTRSGASWPRSTT